jgi:hypothetical protein
VLVNKRVGDFSAILRVKFDGYDRGPSWPVSTVQRVHRRVVCRPARVDDIVLCLATLRHRCGSVPAPSRWASVPR